MSNSPATSDSPAMTNSPTTPDNPQRFTAEVAVIGGGAGGLAASIALARSLRSVIVIDAGAPRNASSAHAHNVLGQEGINPRELLAKGRKEAEAYGVKFIDDTVVSASTVVSAGNDNAGSTVSAHNEPEQRPTPPQFVLETADGFRIDARRIIIATGLTDVLPDIPGLADGWGETVLHCPYCHGYEVRGQNIGVIGSTALSYQQAMMFSQLSDRVTVIKHEAPAPDAEQARTLKALGIDYVDAKVESVSRTEASTILTLNADGPTDSASATDIASPTDIAFDAVAVAPYFRANGELFAQLGGTVIAHPSGMGSSIPAQPTGATDIPGVWAVGNSADMSAMLVASAAGGVSVGAQVNADLIMSSVS